MSDKRLAIVDSCAIEAARDWGDGDEESLGASSGPWPLQQAGEDFLRQCFADSPLAVAFMDGKGRIIEVNQSFTELFGYANNEICGSSSGSNIASGNYLSEASGFISRVLTGEKIIGETLRKHKSDKLIPVRINGSPVVSRGKVIGACAIYEDLSEKRALESELHNKIFFDDLTGLPNADYLSDCIDRSRTMNSEGNKAVVMLIGLNRFKRINGSLGRAAGDKVLVEIAKRIRRASRFQDMQARCGGDKFAVLLSGLHKRDKAEEVAKRYLQKIERPLEVDGVQINLSASIGVVFGVEDYDDASEVLNDAEIALSNAKNSANSRVRIFMPPMHEQLAMSSRMELDMERAVAEKSFELAYQPIVSTVTGDLVSFEALLRWEHPKMGPVAPDRFIQLAEETGLIVPLGRWVIDNALSGLKMLSGRLGRDLTMSVNISVQQLLMDDLENYLTEMLGKYDITPSRLNLEITESVILKPELLPRLESLRRSGVTIGIDDFGTGYSSLGYLKEMPVDFLKIDKSFISGKDHADKEIVTAIINLSERLGLNVVAEGVETRSQLELLRALNCGFAQGYYFSRPIAAVQAMALPVRFK